MRYGSVCSGIEAATMAWHPLGWTPAFFSEIDPAPRAVLTHHYPDVPLHGDFTTIGADDYGPIDLLVGGTPCQSFSVAGLRGGLADARGNLALEFLRLADRKRPRWIVWENVPGVFSSLSHDAPDFSPPDIDLDTGDGPKDGEEVMVEDRYDADENHALACFLAGLSELRYGWAYRVLDAQHFGVPQRRRRVFVVGYLGDWRRAAAVLFERHSLQGHPPPRRETGQAAPTIPSRRTAGGGLGTDFDCDGGLVDTLTVGANQTLGFSGGITASTGDISHCLNAGGMGQQDYETETLIAHSLRGEGFDASEDGTGRGTPLVPVMAIQSVNTPREKKQNGLGVRDDDQMYTITARDQHAICFSAKDHGADASDIAPTLRAGGHSGSHANAGVMPAVAFDVAPRQSRVGNEASTLTSTKQSSFVSGIIQASAVRRLTPRECERLQGFPDDFTLVPYRKGMMADGPRYKMLGNSKAVPVVRWIGERINQVEALNALAVAA